MKYYLIDLLKEYERIVPKEDMEQMIRTAFFGSGKGTENGIVEPKMYPCFMSELEIMLGKYKPKVEV